MTLIRDKLKKAPIFAILIALVLIPSCNPKNPFDGKIKTLNRQILNLEKSLEEAKKSYEKAVSPEEMDVLKNEISNLEKELEKAKKSQGNVVNQSEVHSLKDEILSLKKEQEGFKDVLDKISDLETKLKEVEQNVASKAESSDLANQISSLETSTLR